MSACRAVAMPIGLAEVSSFFGGVEGAAAAQRRPISPWRCRHPGTSTWQTLTARIEPSNGDQKAHPVIRWDHFRVDMSIRRHVQPTTGPMGSKARSVIASEAKQSSVGPGRPGLPRRGRNDARQRRERGRRVEIDFRAAVPHGASKDGTGGRQVGQRLSKKLKKVVSRGGAEDAKVLRSPLPDRSARHRDHKGARAGQDTGDRPARLI